MPPKEPIIPKEVIAIGKGVLSTVLKISRFRTLLFVLNIIGWELQKQKFCFHHICC